MKHPFFKALAFVVFSFSSAASVSAADGPLPFSVTVGGQPAAHKSGEPFAHLASPVAADAPVKVGAKADLTIINVHRLQANGTPDPAVQPAIILLQGTSEGSLDATMDRQKLATGTYLLSVTSGEATASIKFEVK
jgi:hypothetical protein